MWIQENLKILFNYLESGLEVGGKPIGIDILFTIRIQNPWQFTMMQQCGHRMQSQSMPPLEQMKTR
jgi:hypothetical protein